jgi:hypothetical protein
MRYRPTSGTPLGESYFRVFNTYSESRGGEFDMYSMLRIRENATNNNGEVRWLNSAGTVKGYIGPVVVSNTAQVASDWPNGTIWIDPS